MSRAGSERARRRRSHCTRRALGFFLGNCCAVMVGSDRKRSWCVGGMFWMIGGCSSGTPSSATSGVAGASQSFRDEGGLRRTTGRHSTAENDGKR